ncbi:MAG: energy-coupling factor transporter transmembrane protein EcfT [Oscillospiraceae bacterium]|nr:energy-coupling factor transporter transmembrane protein EcfT [Oscillospiraceae bacterium]
MRHFQEMNPTAVTVHLLLTAGIAMFSDNMILLGFSLLCAAAFYVMQKGMTNWRFHFFALSMPLVIAVLNPLWNQHGTTILFFMNQRAVTLEAILYGVMAGMRLSAVLYWFQNFTLLMNSEKIFYLLRCLSPKLALVFSMALRNISVYQGQLKKIHQAQKALGMYRENHLIDDIRISLRVFSVLLSWALENGIITANSMAARGYGVQKRSSFTHYRWTGYDLVLTAVSLVMAASVVWAAAEGYGQWQYYPVVVVPSCSVMNIGITGIYVILASLPLIHEGKEILTWKCLLRKI